MPIPGNVQGARHSLSRWSSQSDIGVPSWVDLGTSDIDDALRFYTALFGWEYTEGSEETGNYRQALVGGKRVAGLMPQMAPGVPPSWSSYINVSSADDAAAKVAAAGGTTFVEAMDVMDFGRMAVFADPTGAAISVWQAGTHIGAELANEPNSFSWNELVTTDMAAAKKFYADVFGWEALDSDGAMPYTEWQLHGRSIGGGMPKPPTMPTEVPSHWAVYFAVDDLDAAVGRVKDAGGLVMFDRMDTPAGPFAAVGDPQGATFNIIELADA